MIVFPPMGKSWFHPTQNDRRRSLCSILSLCPVLSLCSILSLLIAMIHSILIFVLHIAYYLYLFPYYLLLVLRTIFAYLHTDRCSPYYLYSSPYYLLLMRHTILLIGALLFCDQSILSSRSFWGHQLFCLRPSSFLRPSIHIIFFSGAINPYYIYLSGSR